MATHNSALYNLIAPAKARQETPSTPTRTLRGSSYDPARVNFCISKPVQTRKNRSTAS